MGKYHHYRINAINIYIDEDFMNYLDYQIRDTLIERENNNEVGLEQEVIGNLTVKEYVNTHRFLYEPEMFAKDFYDICYDICYEKPLKIYVDYNLVTKYFRDFKISFELVPPGRLVPMLKYSSIDTEGLKAELERRNKES